jgi:hypothetical protein
MNQLCFCLNAIIEFINRTVRLGFTDRVQLLQDGSIEVNALLLDIFDGHNVPAIHPDPDRFLISKSPTIFTTIVPKS